MKHTIQDIQARIAERLPEGKVVPRHDATGHWYEVTDGMVPGPIYPSVTGKLQILKDESLINYKKNKVIDYFFANIRNINEGNIMEHIALAERVPEDILVDAGDIGTQIHDTRERIFSEWIKTGTRPDNFLDFIDPAMPDVRLKSAIRALDKFSWDYQYRPIATELLVYSHEMKVAGTLDDLGVIRKLVRPGDDNHCLHEMVGMYCVWCDAKWKEVFVLMDLKSSNQLKDHYFFQVALYFEMVRKIIGIAPQECYILKLSKEDGTYKVENLQRPGKIVEYAKAMLKTNDAIGFIKSLRKDNQRAVAEKMEF